MRTPRPLIGLVLVAALSSCGTDDGTPTGKDGEATEPSGFTVTRADGSSYELVTFTAACPDLPDGDEDAGYVRGFASLDGVEIDPMSATQPTSPVAMIAVLDDVADGTKLDLGRAEENDGEEASFSFFIADGTNEASSSEEEATGSVEVIRAACEPTPVLEVRIEGRLGSEFSDGETLTVKGYGRLE